MALIKCVECGHDVSDKAQMCMNCGCPVSVILLEICKQKKLLSRDCDMEDSNAKIPLNTTITELYEQGKIHGVIRAALRANGINTLHDLVNCSEEEVSHFKRLGRIHYNILLELMNEWGLSFAEVVFPAQAAMIRIDDLEIDECIKVCLKSVGVGTVNDILNLSGEDFIKIENLSRQSANQLLNYLQEVGVPKYYLLELYWGLEENLLVSEVQGLVINDKGIV